MQKLLKIGTLLLIINKNGFLNMSKFYIVCCFLIFCSCKERIEVTTIYLYPKERLGWEKKVPCTFVFCGKNCSQKITGGVKFRGGLSSKYDKHSFSVKLKESFPVAGLRKSKKWIVNANYIDKTFMRHKISFDLFREMDERNKSPTCSYVNVYKNDEYYGLFVLMERMDKNRLALDKNDSKAMIFKDVPVFTKDTVGLMKYEYQKYPKSSKWKYINEFRDFLINASEEQFRNEISSWIDIENIVDWQLLLHFTNNGDGILKNFYLYKKGKNHPFRIAIWDYDHSFGRDGDNELNMLERRIGLRRSLLFDRLMDESYYREKLKRRWKELRDEDVFSVSNFKQKINQNHVIISSHITKNFERWPVDDKWYYDNNTYEMEIDTMIKFVALNLDSLDSFFEYE